MKNRLETQKEIADAIAAIRADAVVVYEMATSLQDAGDEPRTTLVEIIAKLDRAALLARRGQW